MLGYVYLIGSTVFGWYKIGKSKQPEVRIKDLGILLPFKVHVLCVWKAENASLLEKALHDAHKDNRINGEWFGFTRKEVYSLVGAIPLSALVYPSNLNSTALDRFSNVMCDTIRVEGGWGRVLGVRSTCLKGGMSDEEREQKRIAAEESARLKRTPEAQAALDKRRQQRKENKLFLPGDFTLPRRV